MTVSPFRHSLHPVSVNSLYPSRDTAEICAEKMASNLGYYQKEGVPTRHLAGDICPLCGNRFLVAAGEEGVVENTCKLSCGHT